MNIFTNDDYRRIQAWLKANAIKDSDFAISEDTVPDEDILVITQNMSTVPTNYKIKIKDLLNSSLGKVVINKITANIVKVNNSLTVDASKVILNNEKGTTLQDVFNYFEEGKLNRHTDDTFDGNLTVKKNITIEGNIKSHDGTTTIEADLEATGEITDGQRNMLSDVNDASKGWKIEYQDPQQDEPTVRAKYVLKDYRGVPKGNVIKIYKDSAITNVYLGTVEDTCNENTGEVTKEPVQNNNEALSVVYRLDTGKYSLVNVPIGIFTREAEFDKYRGLGVTENGQVFIKLASDIESSNYLHFNELGEITADGIETRILKDLGNIITSVAGDRTMWGQYKKEEGTKDSTINEASRWGQYKQAESDRSELLNIVSSKVNQLEQAVSNERDARTAADTELQAKIKDHEDRIWKLENQWYGIEWDTEVSSPAVTRIGNMDLHRTLPIQSRMRGCLLDDNGKVVKYLNPKDWTGEVRDGSRGQVMVEIPMHYRRCETDGTKRRVKLSEYPLPGFLPIPRMYPSAYEASLQRSTNKLCSVVNTDPDYRGGDNNAAWDGTYRSLLGRPATAISRTNFRTYARNRNNAATAEWNLYTYHVHKALYWLYVVEYANRNSQLPFTAELTAEGFRQGGLGTGVSDWSWSDLSTFNGCYPFVPCGHTDTLGNATGVVAYTALNADGSELKTSYVPRYRGIENPFGHIWKITDGINVRISPTEENGGDNLSKVFVCEDPSKLNDTNYNGYKHVGNETRTDGYVKEIIFGEEGEIMPSLVGGGAMQFFCDYHYTNIPTTENLHVVLFGGFASDHASDGLAYAASFNVPSDSHAYFGSRLCFLPAE